MEKGLDQKIDQDGFIFNIYSLLWTKNDTVERLRINIPDTVIIRFDNPV